MLDAPDQVLIERQGGKRIDPKTGDVYHATFDWPQDPTIQARLLEPEGISEEETVTRLVNLFLVIYSKFVNFCNFFTGRI